MDEFNQILADFQDVSNRISTIDVNKLPIDLQLSLLNQYGKLAKAVEEFNNEVKKTIVVATMLGRI